MRKNKKLFAILTLVAFMMTLVPALAFAGVGTTTVATAAVDAVGTLKITAANIPANGVFSTAAASGITVSAGNYDTADVGSPLNGTAAAGSFAVAAADVANITADEYIVVYAQGATGNGVDILAKYQVTAAIKTAAANNKAASDILAMPVATAANVAAKLGAYQAASADVKAIVDAADSGALKNQIAADQKVADAFVNFAKDTTAAKRDIFIGKYAAVGDNQEDFIAVLVQNATPAAGYDFTVTTGSAISFAAASANSLASVTTLLETLGVITAPTGPTVPTGDAHGDPSAAASKINTEDTNTTVDATYNPVYNDSKKVNLSLTMKDIASQTVIPNADQDVYIWAETSTKSGEGTDALLLVKADGSAINTLKVGENDDANEVPYDNAASAHVYKLSVDKAITSLKANFVRAGSYTIKASFANPLTLDNAGKNTVSINSSVVKLASNPDQNTVKATAAATNTKDFFMQVSYKTVGQADEMYKSIVGPDNEYIYDGQTSKDNIVVSANTVNTTKVRLHVYNANGKDSGSRTIKLSTNSANIELDTTTITTTDDGMAYFNVAGLREGIYKVYVNMGEYESIITVQVGSTAANNIEAIKFPSNAIAADTELDDYKNIFRFQLTDANGNIVAAKGKLTEGAEKATAGWDGNINDEEAAYVTLTTAPTANKVKSSDLYLKLATDSEGNAKDYYTFGILYNKSFEAEGDYVARIVLDNGRSVEVPFTVKKFDTAVSLHIEYPTEAVELNSITDTPDIYFLDANNVMKKANNRVTVAASGYAVANVEGSGKEAGRLTIKNDEKYIGQTVTVTAVSDKENLTAMTTVTVADTDRSVKLDTTRGQVNANNRVGFKVVDSTGHSVALGNDATVEVTAVVQNTGDADAKVSYSVSGSSKADLKSNGTDVINLSSNKETTATVQIMVKVSKPQTNANDNNTGLSTTYYTGTETFTFGAEADKSVVMTIGSKELVANNVPVTTDVAPFIKDNRTWVPFRALTEAFGAEVEYNAENNTVTTKLNGKTVVLTVGSNVLTVNDEAVTMDVAPYIVDDRVVVPVRFVGEAFGFTVEATQDAAGATASVVFYQK